MDTATPDNASDGRKPDARGKKRRHLEDSMDKSPEMTSDPELKRTSSPVSAESIAEAVMDDKFQADVESGAPASKYRQIEQVKSPTSAVSAQSESAKSTDPAESEHFCLNYFCDEILFEIFKYLDSSDVLAIRRLVSILFHIEYNNINSIDGLNMETI